MAKTTKFEEGFQFGATHNGEPVDSVAELVSLLAEANTDTIKTDDLELVDGVVRAPSEFSITLGVLPSMMATHELVVPRSMPMILPMFCSFAEC